jgi:hypothetical protein
LIVGACEILMNMIFEKLSKLVMPASFAAYTPAHTAKLPSNALSIVFDV